MIDSELRILSLPKMKMAKMEEDKERKIKILNLQKEIKENDLKI